MHVLSSKGKFRKIKDFLKSLFNRLMVTNGLGKISTHYAGLLDPFPDLCTKRTKNDFWSL